MQLVLLTALGVGGATVTGSLIGFVFKDFSHKFSDVVLSFAAGVMLSAAVIGLVLPSLEYGGDFGLIITIAGIFCGALCLNLFDRLVPHLHKLSGAESESHPDGTEKLDKVLLFVLAIAIHNLPEGIAAGVGFERRVRCLGSHLRHCAAEYSRGHGDNRAHACCGNIPQTYVPRCRSYRSHRGAGHFSRLFCGYGIHCASAFCAGICRRHHALCGKRRDDT